MYKSAYGADSLKVFKHPELYDLGADPGEQWNIAAQHPDIVADLTKLAEEHRNSISIHESIFDKKKQ